jgi:hypothetical protein
MRLIRFTALSVAADNAAAAVNSAARFGDRNKKADSRIAAFFMSVSTSMHAFFVVGLGGDTFGYAGSFLPVRQPRLVPASPFGDGERVITAQEGVHHHA